MVFSDLLFANRHVNPVVGPDLLTGSVVELEPRPTLASGRVMVTASAQQQLDNFNFSSPEAAVLIPRRALLLNDNLLERIPKLDGFFSLYLPRAARVAVRLSQQTNSAADGFLDFLGVSHVSRPGKPWEWDARANGLPRLRLVGGAVLLDPTNTLNDLCSEKFNPRERVYLPPEAADQIRADGTAHGKVLAAQVSAQRVEATVESDGTILVTLAHANYPGWRGMVDGRPAALWTANYGFQALEVPAGHHEVRVVFQSRSFELGAVISLASLLAMLVSDFALSQSARRTRLAV